MDYMVGAIVFGTGQQPIAYCLNYHKFDFKIFF